ncbi:MAG: UDP-3-O-(3-hydroxymyristoyl)glucosamine N-acyltransferase [Bacteroidales bacterium]|nr:UDP-3-O-(3-hydroxymyristoyl)glucosamine N-acyltransferase [Bacteroidales bacterium]
MEFSAKQIAALVNGDIEGNGDVMINDFAKIEEGRPGAISFLANPKYTHHIYTTASSAVLVKRDFVAEEPVTTTLIRVDDPYATIARLLTMVQEMLTPPRHGVEQPSFIAEGVEIPADAYVGAFAYIGRGSKIGAGAQIYPQAYVGDGVEIGAHSVLYPGAKVYQGCKIGQRCIIHAGAVIGSDGFGFAPVEGGYEKIPQMGVVVIDDDVEIGANTTIDRAMMGATKIHRGVKLDNLIQIAHNCEVGEWTVMASQCGVAGSSKVGSHCMFGGQVGISGHITIGDRVQLGAQSGVPKSIPSDQRMIGSPPQPMTDFGRQVAALKYLPEIVRAFRAKPKS